MRRPRFFLASIASALATIVIPLICLFVTLSAVGPGGTADDAPYRAAGFLLVSMPIIALVVLAGWFAFTRALAALDRLSRVSLFAGCLMASLLVGGLFGVQGYGSFGLKDAVFSFFMFFGSALVCLSLGALVWWGVAFAGHDKGLQATRDTGAGA